MYGFGDAPLNLCNLPAPLTLDYVRDEMRAMAAYRAETIQRDCATMATRDGESYTPRKVRMLRRMLAVNVLSSMGGNVDWSSRNVRMWSGLFSLYGTRNAETVDYALDQAARIGLIWAGMGHTHTPSQLAKAYS